MFLTTETIRTNYTRTSSKGNQHSYYKDKTIGHFRCDQCKTAFTRDISKISKKRLNNMYYHVCNTCDSKRFAQKKGVERRKLWNMNVDSDLKIDKL